MDLGKTAVVIGAGMGGLAAAAALHEHFERVVVLERDDLPDAPDAPVQRASISQGRHVHALLAGGERALSALLPGLPQALQRSQAVRQRVALALRVEQPGFDPFPNRDLGFHAYSATRPLLEALVRRELQQLTRVELRGGCNVQSIVADDGGTRVTRVKWKRAQGNPESLACDLLVDASGRGELSFDLLRRCQLPTPEVTIIGVDLGYGTLQFELPDDVQFGFDGVISLPKVPQTTRGALLNRVENGRYLLSVGGRLGDYPPADPDAYLEYLRGLRTPTIYELVRRARHMGDIALHRFPESRRTHYERLARTPVGLFPLGDALCRFNPAFGQGMSVAALQAEALRRLLREHAALPDTLAELARRYFVAAAEIIDEPWQSSAIPDLALRKTTGERPANLKQMLRFSAAFTALAARESDVHQAMAEVAHLLKPRAALKTAGIVDRVEAFMRSQQPAEAAG